MSQDAPAFDFYPERWLTGVASFSDAEQISYLRLLCHQWLMDGLPVEVAALKRLGGRGVTPAVLAKFPIAENRRRNARLEIIRQEQRERIAKNREQRRKAAEKRWGKHADIMPPQCGRIAGGDAESMRAVCPPPTTHHPPKETQPHATPSGEISPIDLPTCLAASAALGVTEELASIWWHECDGRGWRDGRGHSIANWRSALKSYAEKWRANQAARPVSTGNGRDKPAAAAAATPPRAKDYSAEAFRRFALTGKT